jgi:hypothetical protein
MIKTDDGRNDVISPQSILPSLILPLLLRRLVESILQ